ncbi:tetratricopeptide repeat protein 17 [Ischnura elegans]|uniref:tetratricopeptide repeat protein 17 n=1 Tax=Ischnura elegans TaxID=197161 RepID=UPI001ED8832E|nr:tetratricopeptide repeat protein 17 [Ischnura elegans]
MKNLVVTVLLCINTLLLINVECTMHWAVTENGRIEAQVNSVFHLRRPYDLIAFMEQETRLHTLDEIYHDLLTRKSAFDRKWVGLDSSSGEVGLDRSGGLRGFNAGDLEARLYAKDPDCVGAGGKPLSLSHLFPGSAGISSLMRDEMRLENNLKPVPDGDEYTNELPDCESSYQLDLSMQAFEHLLGLKERVNLSMEPEPSLESAFLYHLRKSPIYMERLEEWPKDEEEEVSIPEEKAHPDDPSTTPPKPQKRKFQPSKNINHFGKKVGMALARNSTSWPLHNLASLFWRIVGDAPRAIECARRAVHLSPSQHRDVGLAQMGWILLSSGRPAEAAIILHAAVDHAAFTMPPESEPIDHIPLHTAPPATHLALANAYALLSDYNRSLACYDNALKLQPSLKVAQLGRHSVLCQQKLEKALINMVDSLRDMLVELQEYHKKQEEWLKLQEKLLWEQAPLEVRLMNYGQDKILSAGSGHNKNCIHHQKEGHMILSCDLEASHTLETDITLSLQLLMKNVVNQAKKISSAMFHGIGKRREMMSLSLNEDNPLNLDPSESQVYFSSLESKESPRPEEEDVMEFTLKQLDESTLTDHVTWEDVEHLMAEGQKTGASISVCPLPKQRTVEPYICTPISTNPKGAQSFKWQENANNKD